MYARDKKQDSTSSVKNSKSKATAIQFKDLRPEGEHQNTISSSLEQSPRVTAQRKKMDSLQKPIQKKENNTGLPDKLKSGIESLSGMDMSDTRVHYNSSKPAQLQAHAYAQGNQIHVAPGQEKHLPHEAWHVVQQKQGRVQPTMQMKGNVNINNDAGLEREADVMGAKALQMKTTNSPSFNNLEINPVKSKPIQRYQKVIQCAWTTESEGTAQETLTGMDQKIYTVPVNKVYNQQAWMGTKEKGMAKMIPRKYNKGGILQGIKADKVIKRAAEIAKGKVNVSPPPVAFSTGTATAANPQAGKLILLDSHHTKNAAILLSGASTMQVRHVAKPDLKGADTIANVAKSRKAITSNMIKANKFNANEGKIAYEEAVAGIEEIKKEMASESSSEVELASPMGYSSTKDKSEFNPDYPGLEFSF
ncbi:DUF4157 domain-containing protein [uncultured Aquimarina sp.]|uniref:eCIS core domain-containing protein n=1 Tax=uncultured Aquimarina sp. TaxID=575652 RepID=UPI00261C7F45|nr:DUF4157 domain-containing protein [uncultured Aquimarina sp.]